jgi:hypothetical protein
MVGMMAGWTHLSFKFWNLLDHATDEELLDISENWELEAVEREAVIDELSARGLQARVDG